MPDRRTPGAAALAVPGLIVALGASGCAEHAPCPKPPPYTPCAGPQMATSAPRAVHPPPTPTPAPVPAANSPPVRIRNRCLRTKDGFLLHVAIPTTYRFDSPTLPKDPVTGTVLWQWV